MINAAAVFELDVILPNVAPNFFFCSEIKRRICNRKQPPRRQASRVVFKESLRVDTKQMVKDCSFPAQIEICMICQIAKCICI